MAKLEDERANRAVHLDELAKRSGSRSLLIRDEPNPAQAGVDLVAAMTRDLAGQFLASTALSRIEARMDAIIQDNDAMRTNLAKLNEALGDFKVKQVEPLRAELEHIRYSLSSRTTEAAGNLERVTGALLAAVEKLGTLGVSHGKLLEGIKEGRFEDSRHLERANETGVGPGPEDFRVPGPGVPTDIDRAPWSAGTCPRNIRVVNYTGGGRMEAGPHEWRVGGRMEAGPHEWRVGEDRCMHCYTEIRPLT